MQTFVPSKRSEERPFGEQMLDMAYRLILIGAQIRSAKRPHTFFQLLKYFLEAISTQDPMSLHYDIVRKAVASLDDSYLISEHTVDLLTREFVKILCRLNSKLIFPDKLAKKLMAAKTAPERFCEQTYLHIIELRDAGVEQELFNQEDLPIWDQAYLELISSMGKIGKEYARTLKINLSFWFQSNSEYFYYSDAFLNLVVISWKSHLEHKSYLSEIKLNNQLRRTL